MFDGWPVGAVYALLFVGAVLRGNATYWLGRGARRGGESTRARELLGRPMVRRAETLVARFGVPAVTLSFLTVGIQTAINFAAGLLRMPVWRYQIGLFFGALLWALLYTTVGFAVLEAWVGAAPWWAWLLAVAGVAVVWGATSWLRHRLDRTPPAAEVATEE